MRDNVSKLLILILASAGCQGSSGGDAETTASPAKPSARASVGAPPATTAPRAAGAALADVPAYSAYYASAPLTPATGQRAAAAKAAVAAVQSRMTREAPGVVASVDARRPVPSFLFAGRPAAASLRAGTRGAAEQVALAYLDQYRSIYQLDRAALSTAEVARVHASQRGGQIVQLTQRVDDREVFATRMSFLLDRDQRLVAISGHLHPNAGASWTGALDGRAALARAVSDVTGAAVSGAALSVSSDDAARHSARFTAASAGFQLPQPALVREVFYALPKQLVPAFSVVVEIAAAGSTDSRGYEYVVAADDGRILERRNLTFSESRQYSVWADGPEQGYRPWDGPHGDLTPHPTGDVNTPIDIVLLNERILAEVEGLNTNPDGAADPWLPDGATDLRVGNNVSAYADHTAPDGFNDGDPIAPANGNGAFSYNFQPDLGPINGNTQIRTAIAQLFFVNNWLHDWWYDSGFTEATGNAQADNLGRGGFGDDPLLAEAQDGRGEGDNRNNANMSPFPDGFSPRMQMYIFDGPVISTIGETTFAITEPAELAGTYPAQGSDFGVDEIISASGELVLVDDGIEGGTVTDGCEPFTVTAGAIAVVRRGLCAFVTKARNAAQAGAAAVIVVNNTPTDPDALPGMGGSDRTLPIPAIGISYADGERIIAALGGDAVAADITRQGRVREIDRDGTIDNAIVAHEWGHYIHHRLTLCGTQQCGGMSEGWGDFIALHMMVRETDDLHGTFGAAAWATDDAYFGIRRVPYSVEFDRNALTFGMIADDAALPDTHPIVPGGPNSEEHNAGEVWSTMLFEAYVALIEAEPALGFAEGQRRMSDYLVAGMLLAPPDPTFTQQRDAILAAIAAGGDARDLRVVAEAFARRGFGTGAVSPAPDSVDLIGAEESYVVAGELAVAPPAIAVDQDCDEDANLDGGETGTIRVTVSNGGPIALTNTTVTVDDPPAGVSFPDGMSATIAEIGPYQSGEATIAIQLDAAVEGIQSLAFEAVASNEGSAHPSVANATVARINFDDDTESSKVDDVESKVTPWAATSGFEEDERTWGRAFDGENTVWHADDLGSISDQVLTSPALTVGQEAFIVRLNHRYSFEAADPDYYDGGVIEVSTDGGETWSDVSDYVDPGYTGTIYPDAGNPLADRPALSADSAGYPATTELVLDFGTQLAGQTVQLRFRLGADAGTSGPGWDIDDIAVSGIDNSPFTTVVDDEGSCGAGPDDGADDGSDDGDDGDDGDGDDDDDGCGCRSGGEGSPLGFLLFAALIVPLVRRRRRA